MDENELQHLVYTAYKHDGPFAIRIARGTAVGTPLDDDLKELPLGKGVVVREGSDLVAIFALGKSASASLEAADILAERGISCGVVNPIFVKPLDTGLLFDAARGVGRIVTVEENVLAGGFGSAVLEALAGAGLDDVSVHRIGMPDSFVEHGTAADQRHQLQLDAEGIAAQVLSAFIPMRRLFGAQRLRKSWQRPRVTLNNPSARLNFLCVELQSTDLFRPSLVLQHPSIEG